ncbi:hypothetical protein, partial [Enterobacter hormaechei]|uniref:hypothetical protein n=1 Tax=Enterobacter hormaechei TaxID=158836 RepID=UPI0019811262
VVEHDEDMIRAADHVIDMGPGAGVHGGQVIAQGTPEEIARSEESMTGQYLARRLRIPVPQRRTPWGRELLPPPAARPMRAAAPPPEAEGTPRAL